MKDSDKNPPQDALGDHVRPAGAPGGAVSGVGSGVNAVVRDQDADLIGTLLDVFPADGSGLPTDWRETTAVLAAAAQEARGEHNPSLKHDQSLYLDASIKAIDEHFESITAAVAKFTQRSKEPGGFDPGIHGGLRSDVNSVAKLLEAIARVELAEIDKSLDILGKPANSRVRERVADFKVACELARSRMTKKRNGAGAPGLANE